MTKGNMTASGRSAKDRARDETETIEQAARRRAIAGFRVIKAYSFSCAAMVILQATQHGQII
jgi:hypothetical protein